MHMRKLGTHWHIRPYLDTCMYIKFQIIHEYTDIYEALYEKQNSNCNIIKNLLP